MPGGLGSGGASDLFAEFDRTTNEPRGANLVAGLSSPLAALPPVHGDRMTRKLYDKLVRNRIPEIIRDTGSTCGIEILADDEVFRRALRQKLVEDH